jgi:signal transduction histidine kinase
MKVRRFISAIPYWAYLLVLLVIVVNTIYLINMYRFAYIGAGYEFENGKGVITIIAAGSPAEKAGLQNGDFIISINNITLTEPAQFYHIVDFLKVGDIVAYKILRNNKEFAVKLTPSSNMLEAPVIFQIKYIIILLFSFACLYILYKKPIDQSARIFFIYFQLYAMTHTAYYLFFEDIYANLATIIFLYSTFISGPVFIHFILLFPQRALIYTRFRMIPVIIYGMGFLLASFFSIYYMLSIYNPSPEYHYQLMYINRIASSWILLAFCIMIALAIYQFRTIKNTVARDQLRMVIIGSFFGYSAPMAYSVFYDFLLHNIDIKYPFIFYDFAAGITIVVMIICFLIAIFRYRIWDTEIIIKKALLYLSASMIIILSYLLLISLLNLMTERETNFTRFLILAISVIIFLISRDLLQQLIDRIFHRESYDSATVVTSFEEKLAGIYRTDELKAKIAHGLDEIFHFKAFMLNLKNSNQKYQPEYAIGLDQQKLDEEFETDAEFEKKLRKTKVFSPGELEQKLTVADAANAELIVPLVNEDQPFGFFLCGQKKSEKTYSLQDIRVLSLIGKRVIALFQTANLYQKDLDRQLMLERERARISQDMHDDVGASLTRISILSDLAKNKTETGGETKQWLGQISDTSRDVIEEMNQIIWALNPKNDTLEGLVAYLRRFAYEYFEPTMIDCTFDFPENLPDQSLTVEVRRNVYLVVREALHNVVKHSEATKVWISMNMNEHGFKIAIKDDGAGFDPGNLEFPGNGLINMRKRMKDIGGDFKITSKSGKGTEIELVIYGKP